jgi:hypothetical protein
MRQSRNYLGFLYILHCEIRLAIDNGYPSLAFGCRDRLLQAITTLRAEMRELLARQTPACGLLDRVMHI